MLPSSPNVLSHTFIRDPSTHHPSLQISGLDRGAKWGGDIPALPRLPHPLTSLDADPRQKFVLLQALLLEASTALESAVRGRDGLVKVATRDPSLAPSLQKEEQAVLHYQVLSQLLSFLLFDLFLLVSQRVRRAACRLKTIEP